MYLFFLELNEDHSNVKFKKSDPAKSITGSQTKNL